MAMPEAPSTAIISAGRQVLQEFTVTKSIADLNSGPKRLSIPSPTSEAWRFRAAHEPVDVLVECIEHGPELHTCATLANIRTYSTS